jgi:hypothetical protein
VKNIEKNGYGGGPCAHIGSRTHIGAAPRGYFRERVDSSGALSQRMVTHVATRVRRRASLGLAEPPFNKTIHDLRPNFVG